MVYPCDFSLNAGYRLSATTPAIECQYGPDGCEGCTATSQVSYYPTAEDCKNGTNYTTSEQVFNGGCTLLTEDWQSYVYYASSGGTSECGPCGGTSPPPVDKCNDWC